MCIVFSFMYISLLNKDNVHFSVTCCHTNLSKLCITGTGYMSKMSVQGKGYFIMILYMLSVAFEVM